MGGVKVLENHSTVEGCTVSADDLKRSRRYPHVSQEPADQTRVADEGLFVTRRVEADLDTITTRVHLNVLHVKTLPAVNA